jgi:integrase
MPKPRRADAPLKFTDAYLSKLKVPDGKRDITVFEASGSGLGVRAANTGKIAFIVQLRLDDGSRWRETLGEYGKLTIKQAQALVQKRAFDKTRGVDLHEQRDKKIAQSKAAEDARKFTLRELISRWRDKHLVNQRPSYARRAYRSIELAFPGLIDRPAASMTKRDVRETLDIVAVESGPAAARFAASALCAAYGWAAKKDLIASSPLMNFDLPPPTPGRDRVLSANELRRVWTAACRLDYPTGPFVRLLMSTGARVTEIAALRWDEIVTETDDAGRNFTAISLAGERTKTGAPHRIPLSAAALDVVTECRRVVGCPYVFSSDGHRRLNSMSRVKKMLDAEIGEDGAQLAPWVLHDFRHTIVTRLTGEEFNGGEGFDPLVVDKLLGHAPVKLRGVAGRYNHQEFMPLRRRALGAWSDYVAQPPTHAEVVALPAQLVKPKRKRG